MPRVDPINIETVTAGSFAMLDRVVPRTARQAGGREFATFRGDRVAAPGPVNRVGC